MIAKEIEGKRFKGEKESVGWYRERRGREMKKRGRVSQDG